MPDPSDLFTNVYVKGFGVEVHKLFHPYLLFLCISHWKYPMLNKFEYKQANACQMICDRFNNPLLKFVENITPDIWNTVKDFLICRRMNDILLDLVFMQWKLY